MAKQGKRMKDSLAKVDRERLYSIDEAVKLLSKLPRTKFAESLDVAIRLGIDPRKSEQSVRGSVDLPCGLGRTVRVAVFAEGADADAARAAGADIVGLEDLAEQVKKGEMNFDVALATPASMKVVGTIGAVLGPRGLMPSPRNGTVTQEIGKAVESAKAGQVFFKSDKYGLVHTSIGRANFSAENVRENFTALLDALHKAKPSSAKGQYLRSASLSTTMGPGIRLELSQSTAASS